MLGDVDRLINDNRGELAVIVQHAYTLAALRAQPLIRGALARLKARGTRQEVLSYVSVPEHCAHFMLLQPAFVNVACAMGGRVIVHLCWQSKRDVIQKFLLKSQIARDNIVLGANYSEISLFLLYLKKRGGKSLKMRKKTTKNDLAFRLLLSSSCIFKKSNILPH